MLQESQAFLLKGLHTNFFGLTHSQLSLAWVLRGLLVRETAMILKRDPSRLEYGVSPVYLCYGFDFLVKERKCYLAVSLPEAPGTTALWYRPQLPAAAWGPVIFVFILCLVRAPGTPPKWFHLTMALLGSPWLCSGCFEENENFLPSE